ncbi:MAG TPA: DUF47 family protein [Solirubrobacter sp.]|nr:DUF47 family protein [Solirubrobacter sp.]
MRWFLPETPDVLGLLHRQIAVTIDGMEAFETWAGGDPSAELDVREYEHQADAVKRELYRALRAAFVTPLEPEDLFAISRGIDRIINQAKDAVRESDVMACPPDAPIADMAALLTTATRHLDAAVAGLAPGASGTTANADAAIKAARRVERVYRAAMAELLAVDDLREVMARRELYRRGARIADAVVEVAERILYSVVKEA